MKKALLLVVFVLCQVLISQAQTFNYQAAVRDNAGSLIANQTMSVQIKLLDGGPAGTIVYNEDHSVTSNAHGIISLPVGGGVVNGNFTSFHSISWDQANKWIDIWVDFAGGTNYTNLGTSELRFVPYALYAINSDIAQNAGTFTTTANVTSNANGNHITDDFVFGSFQLNSNGSFNAAYNNRMFFDKSKAAFRAGYTTQQQWDEANIGDYSVALGEGGTASGRGAFSMGRNANATGIESFAFGINAGGFADYAKGFGVNARAFGIGSTAIGTNLGANSLGEVQLGQYSTYASGDANNFVATDRMFVIGNGQYEINNALNSDALVMLKNGNTTLNGSLTIDGDNQGLGTSYTLPAQDGTANQVIETDGSGNLAWVSPAADAIPNGGTNGQLLSTDGSNLSWLTPVDNVDDADNDSTNEIELPTGGTDGQVLKTDGSGVYAWIDQPTIPVIPTQVFSTVNNITSNTNGDIATDDFIFGASTNATTGVNDANRMFFDKNMGSFRVGRDIGGVNAFSLANTGFVSTAFGINNIASGSYSTAFGFNNTASGDTSFSSGYQNTASGYRSTTMGQSSIASGSFSFALGQGVTSETASQISLGHYNTSVSGNTNSIVATDRLFVIGNGTNGSTLSDALVMLKNGNTTLNGNLTIDGDNQGAGTAYTLPAQDGIANQVITTDGTGNATWVDATTGTTLPFGGTDGQVLKTDGSGVYSWVDQTAIANVTFSTTSNITSNTNGTIATDDFVFGSTQLNNDVSTTNDNSRMFFDKSRRAFRAGEATGTQWDTVNLGGNSVAFGLDNIASGNESAVFGALNTVTSPRTLVAGEENIVDAANGAVFGYSNTLVPGGTSGDMLVAGSANNGTGPSVILGNNNTTTGRRSFTIGKNLTNESFRQTVLGYDNTTVSGNATSIVDTDRLLVIGNGSFPQKSDALTILKNGNTTLNGSLTIDGDNQGSGTAYTLPGQDGTANQVMTTDGSGNATWVNATTGITLPAGGTDGQLLKTDGSGNYAWVTDAVNDADNDPTNEIELPVQTGESGKILSTNGTATSWIATPTELPSGGTTGQVLKSDGSGGSTWSSDVEATSVKVTSLPAFNVTSNATAYTSTGAKEVGNWDSSVNVDLFNDGSHLNITNGRFTAPVDGLYFFAAQARIDGLNGVSGSNYSRLMIVKNGAKSFQNGLHSIRNADAGTAFYDTQHVSGILKLTAGDYVSVYVETTGDANFTLQVESGFNGYLVNKL